MCACGGDAKRPSGPSADTHHEGSEPASQRTSRNVSSVILVTLDTTRADHLGCYGNPDARTPWLDRLAKEGTQFRDAFCHAPITLPSHASILTGTYPPTHGLRNNGAGRLDESAWLLSEAFEQAGHATAAFVSAAPLDARYGLARGFELYDDTFPTRPGGRHSFPERRGNETTGPAMAWLDSVPRERRLFLWLHYFDPHAPYAPPPPFDQIAGGGYGGEIAYTDYCFGAIRERVRRLDRDETTAWIVTADHGESLGEHGEPSHAVFIFDATMRVPLILRAAPRARGSGNVDLRPSDAIDIAPTALGLAGVAVPATLRGTDLSTGAAVDRQRPVYGESAYGYLEYGWSPIESLRRGSWKLILGGGRRDLYDLSSDPGETRPVPDAPSTRAVSDRLEAELEALRASMAPGPLQSPEALQDARLKQLGYATGAGRDLGVPAATATESAALPSPMDRVEVLAGMQDARERSSEGFTASAVARLRELSSRDPGNPQLALLLATELRRLAGRTPSLRDPSLDEAVRELRRTLDLRPKFTAARNLAVITLLQTEALDEARRVAEETVELGVADADSHFNLYLVHTMAASAPWSDEETALEHLDRCLEIDPTHKGARDAARPSGR